MGRAVARRVMKKLSLRDRRRGRDKPNEKGFLVFFLEARTRGTSNSDDEPRLIKVVGEVEPALEIRRFLHSVGLVYLLVLVLR